MFLNVLLHFNLFAFLFFACFNVADCPEVGEVVALVASPPHTMEAAFRSQRGALPSWVRSKLCSFLGPESRLIARHQVQ